MGRIGTTLVAFLALLAVLVALACTYERGAWNAPDGWIYEWQTLIAGTLAVVSASIVVWVSKYIADRDIRQRRRAGRMHTAAALQTFFWECDDVVAAIVRGQPAAPSKVLSNLTIPDQIGDITEVSEVEAVFTFAASVQLVNENAKRQEGFTQSGKLRDCVEAFAAYSAVGAYSLRNQLAEKIRQWAPLPLPESRLNELKMIVARGRERTFFPDGTDFSFL